MASFARALIVLLSTLGAVSAVKHLEENNTNETEVFMAGGDVPTPLPTASGVLPVTNFMVSIGIANIDDFVEAEFLSALALSMGVDESQVTLSEVKFELSTSYVVAAAISLTDAKTAITGVAALVGVTAEEVAVTVAASRRLSEDGSRHLASHSSTTINGVLTLPLAKAAIAKAAKAGLSDTAGVATELSVDASKVTGGDVKIKVLVKAAVQSVSNTAVAAPTAQEFLEKMQQVAPGKTFTIGEVTIIADPTAAPTKAPTEEEEESGAPKLSGLMHFAYIAVAGLALNAVVS